MTPWIICAPARRAIGLCWMPAEGRNWSCGDRSRTRASQLRVHRQPTGQPGLHAAADAGLRIAGPGGLAVAPAQSAIHLLHLPGVLSGEMLVKDERELPRQVRVGDQHALLGIDRRRTRVEVVGPDEYMAVVDHHRLGVQAGTGRAAQAEL